MNTRTRKFDFRDDDDNEQDNYVMSTKSVINHKIIKLIAKSKKTDSSKLKNLI